MWVGPPGLLWSLGLPDGDVWYLVPSPAFGDERNQEDFVEGRLDVLR